MRVVLDANVFISYLLAGRGQSGTIVLIVELALVGRYTLLLPEELLDEIIESVRTKRKLSRLINDQEAKELVRILRATAQILPPPAPPEAPIVRDAEDDYVYLAARQANADYLVTGDKDLLALADDASPLKIVTPAQFLRVLQESGLVQVTDR